MSVSCFQILLGEHLHKIEFDPPPDSTAQKDQAFEDMPRKAAAAANKRRASNEDEKSIMPKRTKPNKSEESEGWEEHFDGDLLVYKKDMEGREKVK